MSHMGNANLPEMPPPSPWLMAVIAIGAGATLWWLTPDMLRREETSSRYVWGRRSPFTLWPRGARAYYEVSWRLGSALMIVIGLVVLGFQITGD